MAFDPVQVSIPPRAPRLKQGLLSALCRWTLARAGWRIHGAFADVDKLLLIALNRKLGEPFRGPLHFLRPRAHHFLVVRRVVRHRAGGL